MLRFPLKKLLLFICDGKYFIGRFVHAGDDVVKVVDIMERIIVDGQEALFYDKSMSGVWIFDRSKISAFKVLDMDELYISEREQTQEIRQTYGDILSNKRRCELKIISKNNLIKQESHNNE